MCSLADLRRVRNDRRRMDARLVMRSIVEELDRAGEGEIGVLDPQSTGPLKGGEVGLDKNRTCGSRLRHGGVLGVGYKGQPVRASLFNPRHSGYLYLAIAYQFTAKPFRNLAQFHGCDSTIFDQCKGESAPRSENRSAGSSAAAARATVFLREGVVTTARISIDFMAELGTYSRSTLPRTSGGAI